MEKRRKRLEKLAKQEEKERQAQKKQQEKELYRKQQRFQKYHTRIKTYVQVINIYIYIYIYKRIKCYDHHVAKYLILSFLILSLFNRKPRLVMWKKWVNGLESTRKKRVQFYKNYVIMIQILAYLYGLTIERPLCMWCLQIMNV
ncbi:uncharacterized protein BX664DRAFT_80108 [Halteromyces radiatus]|uniref:uncharacterized protein n=1 Tax=Halteromyces radiatus TaxID=101107 RepID=UPI00221E591E|nr:uncharacterized protein BX664DRAFT_80108 [Halteromyces radiatus]KAI8097436.1 hypothetical protein BX664DRAFT_80108 [Halteromyces radiatus]